VVLIEFIEQILSTINVCEVDDPSVEKMAVDEGLTFYDVCYV
jgi:hypothetical protein